LKQLNVQRKEEELLQNTYHCTLTPRMPSLILDYNVWNTPQSINSFFLTSFLSPISSSHGLVTLMFFQYYQPPYHNNKLQWMWPEEARTINQRKRRGE
jgi:hypothetical protein